LAELREVRVVALPTQVATTVVCWIDLRDSRLGHGIFGMALSTEGPLGGKRGLYGSGGDLVLLRGLMTCGTAEVGVVGHALLAGDLPVASAAGLGGDRGFRGVGRMTGHAGTRSVVSHGLDLRKPGGTRGAEPMTEGASLSVSIDVGFGLHWSCNMIGGRAVADFAGNSLVVACHPHGFDVRVAQPTLLTASVFLLVACHLFQRSGSVMPKLSKGLRDEYPPGHH
jgi:hypothetical protein